MRRQSDADRLCAGEIVSGAVVGENTHGYPVDAATPLEAALRNALSTCALGSSTPPYRLLATLRVPVTSAFFPPPSLLLLTRSSQTKWRRYFVCCRDHLECVRRPSPCVSLAALLLFGAFPALSALFRLSLARECAGDGYCPASPLLQDTHKERDPHTHMHTEELRAFPPGLLLPIVSFFFHCALACACVSTFFLASLLVSARPRAS